MSITRHVPTSLAAPRDFTTQSPEELAAQIRQILVQHNHYHLNLDAPWLDKVFAAYRQPHRFFHTLAHLRSICEMILHREGGTAAETAQLLLTALFHDVVWMPQRDDNEARSAEAFDLLLPEMGATLPKDAVNAVRNTILATEGQREVSAMAREFHAFDCHILLNGTAVDLLAYEFQIFREFQFLSLSDYRKGRSAFFQRFSQHFPKCRENMQFLNEYLERRRPRIGIYAGTFNPFHIGHMSILKKAELMFDKIIIAVGINPSKNTHRPGTGGDAMVNQVKGLLPFREVIFFDTLMTDLLNDLAPYADTTLVRGLRNGYDLDYEMNQQCFMQEMRPETKSVYIPCDKSLEHVSSSALRNLRIFDCHGQDAIYYPHDYDYFHWELPQLFQ